MWVAGVRARVWVGVRSADSADSQPSWRGVGVGVPPPGGWGMVVVVVVGGGGGG